MRTTRPDWLKVRLPGGPRYAALKATLRDLDLHTVCEEARCPNIGACWGAGTATFMVLGDACTRGCRFCAVRTARRPAAPDPDEPAHVARAVAALGLDHVVLTCVDRDDLPDGGAAHLAETVRALRALDPTLSVECLTSDYRGDPAAVRTVVDARPQVFAHNLETVERLQGAVRDPRCGYAQSLSVLEQARAHATHPMRTKSSLMVGLGETLPEVYAAMRDLRGVGVSLLTLGQYLQPSHRQLPVAAWVSPAHFDTYAALARALGFEGVAAGPLVRSSYQAGALLEAAEGRRT